jgi:DNA-binding MarR family transcriptional regulator
MKDALSPEFLQAMISMLTNTSQLIHDLQQETKAAEVTPLQGRLLDYLYYQGEKSLSEIAHCLYIPLSNASREVSKLVDKGFLKKVGDPKDKRIVRMGLTEAGAEHMRASQKKMVEKFQELYCPMDSRVEKELTLALEKINRGLFSV